MIVAFVSRHKHLSIKKAKRGQTLRKNSQNLPLISVEFSSSPPESRFWEMISFEFHLEKWHNKTPKLLWFRGFPNRYLFRFALLARSTEKDITCQVDINNRYTCNNLYFADCIHRNYPQHFLLFHISYMLRCYQTNCTYLLLN